MKFEIKGREFDLFNVITTGIAVLLLIGALLIGFLLYQDAEEYKAGMLEKQKELAELEKAYNDIRDFTEDEATVKQDLSSAAAAGGNVAKYQSAYFSMSPGDAALTDNAGLLSEYFEEDAMNARVPWYLPSVEKSVMADWQWKFHSIYHFSESEIPVVWTLRGGKEDALLAYAVGTYHADSDKFSDITYGMTTAGGAYVESEEMYVDEDKDTSIVVPFGLPDMPPDTETQLDDAGNAEEDEETLDASLDASLSAPPDDGGIPAGNEE